MASDDPRCPACGTVCAYTSDGQRGTWERYCGGLRCMNVWTSGPSMTTSGMTREEWESIGRKRGWLPWSPRQGGPWDHRAALESVPRLDVPDALRGHAQAQALADAEGVPVRWTITAVVLGQPAPTTTVWVEPLDSIGQWTIIRSPDGSETPVRTSAPP